MNRCDSARRLLILIAGLFLLSGCLIDQIGGAFSKQPEELERNGSATALKLIEQSFEGIDPTRIVDFHTHILAIGTSVRDAFVNPKMRSGVNLERLKFLIYVSAVGVKNIDDADREYVARLIRLARGVRRQGKYRILAFDKHYNQDGSVNLAKTSMYVPNQYVVDLARQYPEIFLPVISVHPYRPDAIQELDSWAKAGVKYVKWLPNAMGMDPASKSVEPFYRMMKERNMILLSHAGEEQAVEADEDQGLGNPLRLRKPLDMGIRVIIAHAASLGTCDDLDRREAKKADCFDLISASDGRNEICRPRLR